MPERHSIVIIDDDEALASALAGLLRHARYEVRTAASSSEALREIEDHPTALALLDLRLGDESGLELLPQLKARRPEMSVIILTALGTIENAVEAMRLGADNFVVKPVDPPQLLATIAKGLEARDLRCQSERWARLRPAGGGEILSRSPAMQQVVRLAETVAPRDTTVLLTGETGVGKGVLARHIHRASRRGDGPFVELNCAGLQRELTETELFGHEQGAFTGATERKLGLFEAADGGTLLLDEIGEMDPAVQAKLLHVLETGRFRRLGGVSEIGADVRLIAATHRDLARDVEEGRFREDLLYRLNVFRIAIPPLRDRADDILPLAMRFLAEFRGTDDAVRISPAAEALLVRYEWPGNVRELRNLMERATILCPPERPIEPVHLPPLSPRRPGGTERSGRPGETMREAERRLLEKALAAHGGNIRATARDLGVSRGTLYRKMRKYGLRRD